MAHPCTEVCPKDAIHVINGRSVIDQEKCIRCGRCQDVCPYSAIIKQERPCAKACGINAIKSDENGCAEIDYDKCVSCGMCLVNCPFGAIADKAQIFQVIQAIKKGDTGLCSSSTCVCRSIWSQGYTGEAACSNEGIGLYRCG